MSQPRVPVLATLALVSCLSMAATAAAQTQTARDAADGRKSGTYLKLGLAYWQGDIFGERSLTRWSGEPFGADYALTSLGVEFETFLPWTSFPISGFGFAYRKDAIPSIESGHMLSATLFYDFDLKPLAVKVGGGGEWGIPSVNFDEEEFDDAPDGTVRYRHTYLYRNSTVPVGSRPNGALYPFLALSVVNRPGRLLLEFGMRVSFIEFHFDDYEVRPGDEVMRAFDEKRVRVPYLFANLGLRVF